MGEHTPGPWKVAPIIDSDAVPTSIWAQGGAIWIAEMKDHALSRDNPNALLIAAAPDLLAAVEGLMPMLEAHQEQDKSLTTVGHTAINAARDALTKARA